MSPQYRKLPGKRRGFIYPSSVWAGPDHLLLVRGSRFREEYKRFYYRDVQAIAVARAPRFHISTRSVLIVLLMIPTLLAMFMSAFMRAYTGSAGYTSAGLGLVALAAVLIGVWVYVSAARSCRCRIYTAVSSDELPSVYRSWTARKFLAEVEPLIAQTQGTIQGEWAAAAEERTVGPAPAASSGAGEPAQILPRRTPVSDLFLASLFFGAVARIAPLPATLASWLPTTLQLVTVALAVAVLAQHNRGRLRAGMQRVAIASLLSFGLLYYVQTMTAGISASLTAAKTRKSATVLALQQSPLIQKAGVGIDAILLIVGLIISLREDQ